MEIEGYTYIQHNIKERPWGHECQFTVATLDGAHINDVIAVESGGIKDADLSALIAARCNAMTTVPESETIEIINEDGSSTEIEV
jgi:hypothetical protein